MKFLEFSLPIDQVRVQSSSSTVLLRIRSVQLSITASVRFRKGRTDKHFFEKYLHFPSRRHLSRSRPSQISPKAFANRDGVVFHSIHAERRRCASPGCRLSIFKVCPSLPPRRRVLCGGPGSRRVIRAFEKFVTGRHRRDGLGWVMQSKVARLLY